MKINRNVSNLSLFFLVLLIFLNKNYANEIEVVDCQFKIYSDTITINISVVNNSKQKYYIPMQFWEAEIISEGNHMLAYPYENYAVNTIYIYSEKFSSLRTTGSKCCFPEYKFYPKLLTIKPDSITSLNIIIPTEDKILDTLSYRASISLNYYSEKSLKTKECTIFNLLSGFNYRETKNNLFINSGMNDFKELQSTFEIKDNFLIEINDKIHFDCIEE